jgi:hypothetical protein
LEGYFRVRKEPLLIELTGEILRKVKCIPFLLFFRLLGQFMSKTAVIPVIKK